MFDRHAYTERRKRLQERFDGGLLLFPGNADAPMNYGANAYHFRQDSSFLYYWGVDDPELIAVLDVESNRHVLFGNDFTVDDIVWRGPQPTIAERAARAGVTETEPLDKLPGLLSEALRTGRRIHYLSQYRADNAQLLERLLGIRADMVNYHASTQLARAVVDQRAHKAPEEVAEIESALEIGHDMHVMAMQMARPGMLEREVAGAIEGLVSARGVALAFPVIFSVHGETLHNHYHGNRMEAGQMAVNDSGCESLLHYACDITRTIPIGGRFQGVQRDLYQSVLNAQRKAIAEVKPGVMFRDIHLLASRSMAEDLKSIGLMKGNLDAAIEQGAQGIFFQCGLGHMLGLDVHDMEGIGEQFVGYAPGLERSKQFGLKSLRMARALDPGMVLTVEPGVYMIPVLMDRWRAEGKFAEFIDYDAFERFKAFGGIRLEDDVLVTETGSRVLGKPIPIEMEEVEAIAGAGAVS